MRVRRKEKSPCPFHVKDSTSTTCTVYAQGNSTHTPTIVCPQASQLTKPQHPHRAVRGVWTGVSEGTSIELERTDGVCKYGLNGAGDTVEVHGENECDEYASCGVCGWKPHSR